MLLKRNMPCREIMPRHPITRTNVASMVVNIAARFCIKTF